MTASALRFPAALLGFALLAAPLAAEACPDAVEADRVAGVDGHGGLALAAGGPAQLMGVRLPETGIVREAALAALALEVGRPVRAALLSAPDRWERRPARIIQGEEAGDLALALLEAGLALADPTALDPPCRALLAPALLAAEGAALRRGLGLWAEEGYKPVSVADIASLRARIGRFTIVEGRVQSVGERRAETYVNFSRDWSTDFTLIVPRRIWTRLTAQGLTASSLTGRRIRVRGVPVERGGPAIVLRDEILLQRLEPDPAASR